MKTQRLLLSVSALLVLFVAGGLWLWGQESRSHLRSSPQIGDHQPTVSVNGAPTDIPSSSKINSGVTSSAHMISAAGISPSYVAANSRRPVTVTAQIRDASVLPASVDLVEMTSAGPLLIGQLHDDGVSGDVIAGDGVYTFVVTSLSSLPIGQHTFRVTAAFQGSITRVQTNDLLFAVTTPAPTSGWVVLHDKSNVFTVSVPAKWGIAMVEDTASDPKAVKNCTLVFPDGQELTTIQVFTPAGWDAEESGLPSPPVYVGKSASYVVGVSDPDDSPSQDVVLPMGGLISLQSILSTRSQIESSIHVN